MMRQRIILSVLAPLAFACSGDQSTEIRPEFAVATCTAAPSVTATPLTAMQPPQNGGVAKFVVKNNCASESATFIMTPGKTGSVSAVFTPTPANHTLAAGLSVPVDVPYNTGVAGSGGVVLTATQSQPLLTKAGSQTVTVGNCTANPTVTASARTALQPPQNGGVATFTVKNKCTITVAFSLTSNKSGSVSAVFTPNPAADTLTAGQSTNVTVPYNTGVPGPGTVILTASALPSLADSGSQAVVVAVGLPFGPDGLWATTTTPNTVGASSFTMSFDLSAYTGAPPQIIDRINAARAHGLKLVLAMTGGAHDQYTTNGVFDIEKWKHGPAAPGGRPGTGMDGYNTSAIKAAVANAVNEGVVLGNSVMDEPPHPTWGPPGTLTKPIVDQMCAYVRGIFPGLPVGPVVVPEWRTQEHYQSCDFIIGQFEYDMRPDTTPSLFKNSGLAVATNDGISVVFSMNVLDGGARRTGPSCTPGTLPPNCQMTASELQNAGLVLGPAGAGLLMWRYDLNYMGVQANQNAFTAIANNLLNRPTVSWYRP